LAGGRELVSGGSQWATAVAEPGFHHESRDRQLWE